MSLKVQTAADTNRLTYLSAAELKKEMSRPDGRPEKLDFSTDATCLNCDGLILLKPWVCSGCKSDIYCSRKCQVANWKAGRFGAEGHNFYCERNKRYMLRVPEARAILKLFPWGKLESDGTFAESLARACFGVLGANGYGYWSKAGGSAPHQPQPGIMGIYNTPFHIDPVEGYQDGYLLLLDQHLEENAGWKLEDKWIPKLHFEPGCEPLIASSTNIVDWKSWYQWRSLPLESPAALLMHYPLTVYYLLVNVLNVAGPSRGSSGSRQTLHVHYLGAEVELNMLPLFSELALLLPYTDLKLTFFGYGVYQIMQKANEKCIAAKAKRKEPVYTYESPVCMGRSTLAIYLDGDHESWEPSLPSITNNLPDAIVALNAGLPNYMAWTSVLLFCLTEEMPFGVTEYTEHCAERERESFWKIIHHARSSLPHMSEAQFEDFARPGRYPIEFNPFQRPGQRAVTAIRLPNASNGFTIRVFGRDSVKTKEEGGLVCDSSRSHIPSPTVEPQVRQVVYKIRDMSLSDHE